MIHPSAGTHYFAGVSEHLAILSASAAAEALAAMFQLAWIACSLTCFIGSACETAAVNSEVSASPG
jgi:hypothetical protein